MEPALADLMVRSLRKAGVNFVSYLPESRLTQVLPLLAEDPEVQLVPVASEAEAVTIAAGAVLGGKRAACYMESTGLFASTYSLLVARQLGIPLLLVVGFLGGFEDQRNQFLYATIGNRTIPLLQGLGFEYKVLVDGHRLEANVQDAMRTANAQRLPVALLFSGDFTV